MTGRRRALRLNRPPRYKLYHSFRLVSGLTRRDSLVGFPRSAPSHALNCTVAYCRPFYSITVAGAASVLFAHSENSPTSHFILQTTVCRRPETILLGECMRRRKNLQVAAEKTIFTAIHYRSKIQNHQFPKRNCVRHTGSTKCHFSGCQSVLTSQ